MPSKYYAVRRGKKTGIFRSWDICKAQVTGYSGAEYKSFTTEEEARNYLAGPGVIRTVKENKTLEQDNLLKQDGTMYSAATVNTEDNKLSKSGIHYVEAYVDGSYNKITDEFSYGMIVLRDGQEYKFAKKFQDKELATMHNVAGEIKGAEAAMRYAVENHLEGIKIYHDYAGIAYWCLGEWKTNKDGTKAYKAFYDSVKDKVDIQFVKVTGHSNDKYNDIADELAKQAVGILGPVHVLEDWN